MRHVVNGSVDSREEFYRLFKLGCKSFQRFRVELEVETWDAKFREVILFRWMNRKQEEAPSAKTAVQPAPKLDVQVRPLSMLDKAMIEARIRTLGINDILPKQHKERLNRLVTDHCRNQKEGTWWEPLRTFAVRGPQNIVTQYMLLINQAKTDGASVRDWLVALGRLLDGSGVLLKGIRVVDVSEEFGQGARKLNIQFEFRERKGSFPVLIVESKLQMKDMIGEINQILSTVKWGNRLFFLGSEADEIAILRCSVAAAKRAHQLGWGSLGKEDVA